MKSSTRIACRALLLAALDHHGDVTASDVSIDPHIVGGALSALRKIGLIRPSRQRAVVGKGTGRLWVLSNPAKATEFLMGWNGVNK